MVERSVTLRLGTAAIAFALCVTTPAQADEDTAGPMTPLPSELLAHPIRLTGSCSGVTITEWRGTQSKKAIKLMDVLCRGAIVAFPGFARDQGLKPDRVGRLSWNVALLPDGHCYRCLNDRKQRFAARSLLGDLWGYTNRDDRYIYITNEIFDADGRPNQIWVKSFVHELAHAMSMHLGIYERHSSTEWRRAEIEKCATKFTAWVLGD